MLITRPRSKGLAAALIVAAITGAVALPSPALAVSHSCSIQLTKNSCWTGVTPANAWGGWVDWKVTTYTSYTVYYQVIDKHSRDVVKSGSTMGNSVSGTIFGLVGEYEMRIWKGSATLGAGATATLDNEMP